MNAVSSFQIFAMIVNTSVCLVLFIGSYIWLRRNRDALRRPYFWGMLTYAVIGIGMKYIFVSSIRDSYPGIAEKNFLYALISGIMSAVTVEGGRYLILRYLMRKYDKQRDALMYGAGYAGTEAFLFSGISAFFGFTLARVINSGSLEQMLEGLDSTAAQIITTEVEKAYANGAGTYFLISIECITTFIIEVCLTILVFKAARDKSCIKYLGIAAGIHLVYTVLAQLPKSTLAIVIVEILIAAAAYISYRFAKPVFETIPKEADSDLFWETLD